MSDTLRLAMADQWNARIRRAWLPIESTDPHGPPPPDSICGLPHRAGRHCAAPPYGTLSVLVGHEHSGGRQVATILVLCRDAYELLRPAVTT